MTQRASSSFAALPFMPLDPAWLEQSAAFVHPDPRVGLGYVRVLLAAWRGRPAASIPMSHGYVSQVTNLPQEVVVQAWSALTDGFELREDGRLHHVHLAKVTASMQERFGREIEEFALSAAMAVQAPHQFSLLSVEKAGPGARGKRPLPRDFGYATYPELSQFAADNGYPTEEDRAWVMRRFLDHARSRNISVRDWAAEFRNWIVAEIQTYRRLPPSRQRGPFTTSVVATSQPSRAGATFAELAARSRGEVARDHNAGVFSRTPVRRAAQSAAHEGESSQGPEDAESWSAGAPADRQRGAA